MRCAECGYQNDEDLKVCVKCGTKLNTPSEGAKADSDPSYAAPQGGQDGGKTMKGTLPNQPAWDPASAKKTAGGGGNDQYHRCPDCGHYPLQEAVSAGSPCPNCQATGTPASAQASPEAGKTAKLESVDLGPQSYEVRLTDIRSEETLDFEGQKIALGRESLDPSNDAISSNHAVLEFRNGTLYLKDNSSNQATFIQVKGEVAVPKGSKIVIGSKIYTVTY